MLGLRLSNIRPSFLINCANVVIPLSIRVSSWIVWYYTAQQVHGLYTFDVPRGPLGILVH